MIVAQCHVGVNVFMLSEPLTSSRSLYIFIRQIPILAPATLLTALAYTQKLLQDDAVLREIYLHLDAVVIAQLLGSEAFLLSASYLPAELFFSCCSQANHAPLWAFMTAAARHRS